MWLYFYLIVIFGKKNIYFTAVHGQRSRGYTGPEALVRQLLLHRVHRSQRQRPHCHGAQHVTGRKYASHVVNKTQTFFQGNGSPIKVSTGVPRYSRFRLFADQKSGESVNNEG